MTIFQNLVFPYQYIDQMTLQTIRVYYNHYLAFRYGSCLTMNCWQLHPGWHITYMLIGNLWAAHFYLEATTYQCASNFSVGHR